MSIFAGRYNRAKYALIMLIVAIPLIILRIVALEVDLGDKFIGILKVVFEILGVVAIAVSLPITVKRLHDVDKSGWYCLLFLVPVANVILGFYLLFKKGTQGINRFGEDPLSSK
jgi:uncharacterized membrane protein YhaH (DUF805 family)